MDIKRERKRVKREKGRKERKFVWEREREIEI